MRSGPSSRGSAIAWRGAASTSAGACSATSRSACENVWNGRPISLLVLAEPLEVLDGATVPMIELIPPVHQRVYKTVEADAGPFKDGFHHVVGWVPQQHVTATGPNPLPR